MSAEYDIVEITAPAHGFIHSSVKLANAEKSVDVPMGMPTTIKLQVPRPNQVPKNAKGIFFDGPIVIISFGAQGRIFAELTAHELYTMRFFVTHESGDAQNLFRITRLAIHVCQREQQAPFALVQTTEECSEKCLGVSIQWS